MTDPTTGQQQASAPSTGATTPSRTAASSQMSSLTTEHGTTTIADTVVSKIAALAAREVDGVAELGGSFSSALGDVVGRIRGNEHRTTGVGVEVGTTQAAVDLTVKVTYPASIHQVADNVRQNIIDRIEGMTGLDVVEVNIAVVDLVFPGEEDDTTEDDAPPAPSGRVA